MLEHQVQTARRKGVVESRDRICLDLKLPGGKRDVCKRYSLPNQPGARSEGGVPVGEQAHDVTLAPLLVWQENVSS